MCSPASTGTPSRGRYSGPCEGASRIAAPDWQGVVQPAEGAPVQKCGSSLQEEDSATAAPDTLEA